ncbi:MAG: protein kinase [bacterium]|nr:protein kinase [bacterium]
MALRSDLHGQELVAVKDGGPAEALRHEAELLAELSHPGIVRFVALTEDERGLRLLTRYAGRETLATWQPQRLEELRRVFEDLAGTVGHLHERGVVHRSIHPSHVVVDALRRPLLCGFSSARRFGAAAADRLGGPPRGPDDAAERPAPPASAGESSEFAAGQLADVAALGETALAALRRLEGQKTRGGPKRDDPRLRERLEAVAQAAASGRVPSAKALAGQIGALGGAPGRPQTAGPNPPDRRRRSEPRRLPQPRSRPRRATLLAVAAVGAGCALGTLMIMRLAGADTPPPLRSDIFAVPVTAAGETAGALSGQEPAARLPQAAGVETSEAPRSADAGDSPATSDDEGVRCLPVVAGFRDVTGDGCAAEIRITSGFVSVNGTRYPVGEAGDQVAVGDWDCDGIATVALVRTDGRVYVFDSWPSESSLRGRLVADLPPPVQLADVPRGRCNELLVRYAEGTWYLPLPVPSE